MKVKTNSLIPFDEISVSEVFWDVGGTFQYCMKVNENDEHQNAVNLATGELLRFKEQDLVNYMPEAKLVVP